MQVVFVFCSIQVNYSHTQQLLLLFVSEYSQLHGDISRIPKDNDWISTECPGQEAFPSHQTLYTEPEVCNARGLS